MERPAAVVSSDNNVGEALDAFQSELVDCLPRLRRFARSLARDAADADDLVQAAVERGLSRRGQWKPGTSLLSWMFTIMKNAWIDETRSRGRQTQRQAPAEAGERAPDPAAADPVARLAVQRAMGALPADQRLAVALVLVEGLSYAEASRVLEIPEGTLTSRLVRGRMTLMAELAGLEAGR
jgi:RNA polymerase sigma-70 factor (ECF subfamily)